MNQQKDPWQKLVSRYQLPDHPPKIEMQTIHYINTKQKKFRFFNTLVGLSLFILTLIGYYLMLSLAPVSRFVTHIWLQLTSFYIVNFYSNFYWGFIYFTIITAICLLLILGVMILVELGLQSFGD
jgi:hypothetical protein